MLIQVNGVPDDYGQVLKNLPVGVNTDLTLLMAERFQYASDGMQDWANRAKQCVEFFEGKQWSEDALKKLEREDRPALTFNKISPLVRLVLGYHRNNRMDTKYLPSFDNSGSHTVAEAITRIVKQSNDENDKEYVDAEVFFDGILTGRGYYDYRLNFERNDLGEIKARAKDPFAIYPDPEADQYDLNEGNYVFEGRWVNLDEVEFTYGKSASQFLWGFVHRGGYAGGIPFSMAEFQDEITPWRNFGGQERGGPSIQSYLANCYDPARKNIRLIDCQHYIRTWQRCIVDLESGRREPIPDSWDGARLQKLMAWCDELARSRGTVSPFRVVTRPVRRVRWTTMVGDLLVYDNWSPYETFTLIPFFPYFRRGQTKGMVDDLIDPQVEINKRRSARVDIVTRTAHAGWMYHQDSLREEEKQKLEEFGAMPGINLEWRGEPGLKPSRIEPGVPPMAFERLEEQATGDLKEISGINDSALGQLDRVQSGRALEARQRQSVLSIQTYMDNNKRSNKMCGRKHLEMVQNHMSEERSFRILNPSGEITQETINLRLATGQIHNDVTVGNYTVSVDETPLSANFLSAQFEELMDMVEKGLLPAPLIQDIAVDISSLPRKDEIKQRINAIQIAQGIPVRTAAPMAPQPATMPGQPMAAAPGQGMTDQTPTPIQGNPMAAGAPLNG